MLVINTWPLKSTIEAGRIALAAEPLPDFVKRLGVYLEYGGKGVKGYDLFEIEKGREDEGVKTLTKRYTDYYDLEGFELTMKVVLSLEDALPLVGLGT